MGQFNKIRKEGVCVDDDELPLLGELLPFVWRTYSRTGRAWFCSAAGQRVRTDEPMAGSGTETEFRNVSKIFRNKAYPQNLHIGIRYHVLSVVSSSN